MPATKDTVINKEELKLRPEDIVRILSEKGSLPDSFNPYGKYKVGKLKFLGDTEPPLKKTGYHGADEWILVNDGDDELIPIYISLPKPPPVSKIDGYKLPRDEQVFRRLDMPEGISKLQTMAIDSLGERQRANYQESIQGYKIYREYWAILEAEPEKYKEEIAWMKKAWWHRIYGYWFYNDGQPTYITGDYFDFLQFWYISEANTHPEYRDKDRIKYNFAKYIEECTETFESMDKDTGRALKEADGTYKMRDIGRRVFFGDVEPKTRRSGATHQCVHKVWKGNSTTEGAYGTIISMEGRNAEKHYFRKLLPAWDKYPMFLRPIWTGNRRPTSIKMIEPPTVYDMEGLNSMIDYTDSAGERKNDGDRLNYVLQDEMGKCFGYGTEIIMADGSIKRVQDIRDGEQVMGDDGTPRNVYGCTHGDSEMFSVTSKFGEFICNKEHILSLRSSAAVAGCKSAGEIVNIPLVDVLKLSDNVKKNLKVYRKPKGRFNKHLDTSWFEIKSIGQGKYYGFAVDGNHLFLLKNQIVVHNTITSDVFERWNVNKIAMSTGGGTNIIKNSYAKNPSTVEEMESGGVSYYKLCQLSCFYERMHIKGQTYSGLARIFFPAYVGLEGYIDKFGKSVIDAPTERQIKLSPNALFAMSKKGAKETLQEERDMLLTKGTPEALEQYRSLRRKHPFCWEECWLGSAGSVGFDLEILDKRLGEINREKSFGKLPYKIGNLRRVSDENSEVVFEENREGKFKISMLLPEGLTNRRTQEMGFDASKGAYVPMWKPIGGEMFTLGADPFQYMNKNLAKQSVIQSRQSDGGLAVLYDDRKGKQCFVLSYRNRPASQHEYMEDAIMACQYFSCMCYPETNITDLYKHFIERGYGGYLLYQIDIQTGRFKDKPGEFTRQESRDGYFAAVKDFIQFHGAEENHDDILKEFRDVKGPDDMTHYDLFTAAALALRGNMTRTRQVIESQNSMVIDLGDIGMFRKKRF